MYNINSPYICNQRNVFCSTRYAYNVMQRLYVIKETNTTCLITEINSAEANYQ